MGALLLMNRERPILVRNDRLAEQVIFAPCPFGTRQTRARRVRLAGGGTKRSGEKKDESVENKTHGRGEHVEVRNWPKRGLIPF